MGFFNLNFLGLIEGTPAYLIAGLVVAIVLLIGLPAIPKLLRELAYYRANGWNLNLDSKIPIYRQEDFIRKFGFLPLGLVKILYYTNRILLMCIVVIPLAVGAWRGLK